MPAPFGNLSGQKWPVEHDVVLTRLRAEGYSSSQIATELWREFRTTYSRNAVIGRASRLGLVCRKPAAAPRMPPAPRKPRDKIVSRVSLPPQEPATLRCVEIDPRHLSLIELESNDCRWPYGDGPFTFCGHPKFQDGPYCGAHYHLGTGMGTFRERRAEKIVSTALTAWA